MKFKYTVLLFSMFFVILLVGGTLSSFYGQITGNISATTDNWSFVASITNSTTVGDHFTLPLSASVLTPGSSGSFVVNVDASGTTLDIEYNVLINGSTIPTNMDFCLDSACTDIISKENGTDIILPYNTTSMLDSVTIYWKWTANKYASDDAIFTSLQVADIFVRSRKAELAIMKNGNSFTAASRTEFWSDTYAPYLRTISFDRGISNVPGTCDVANLCWDISASGTQEYHVYAYMEDSGYTNENTSYTVGATLYNLHIASEREIYAPSSSDYLFMDIKNLVSINFDNNFDTSNVTNMVYMFYRCKNLTSLDVSGFNTSNVTGMFGMFQGCSSLTSLDLSGFNTSKVTMMSQMFQECSSLTSLDVNGFNTSNVIGMRYMFQSCSSLTSLDLSNFNTSKVTDMSGMFYECSNLISLDLSGFNTSNVTDMDQMFEYCSSLTSLDLSSFDTSKVTIISQMFNHCSSLTILDLSSFNTSNVIGMKQMFQSCSSLTSLDVSSFDFSSVTDTTSIIDGVGDMFMNCPKLSTTINMNGANIIDYDRMFHAAATDATALITVNYTAETSDLVDLMIATKSATSNVVKGTLIS